MNDFGAIAVAGNTAASNLEGFVYSAMNSIHQTCLSFTSQNLGGGKYSRITRTLLLCLATVTVVGLVMGGGFVLAGPWLLKIYSPDPPEVIHYGYMRLVVICSIYFICGWMDVLVGSLRGLGFSVVPMIVSILGACGLRVVWIFTVFRAVPTLTTLYLSYPVSWSVTAAVDLVCFLMIKKRFPKER